MKTTPSKLGITLAGVLALVVLPARGHANAIAYTVTDLGANLEPQSINASGQVTGWIKLGGGVQHPFFYDGATVTDLGSLGGTGSKGFGINAAGHIVGYSAGAFVWNGTTMSALDPASAGSSEAFGINASGQVAGESGGRPVMWTGTTQISLGTLPGAVSFPDGTAQGINDLGQVTGIARNINTNFRAFLYTAGTGMTDLGTLGGTDSFGFAINNSGQVTGWSNPFGSGSVAHAFLYTAGTGMIDLGTLGGSSSKGFGINAAGDVIGMRALTGNASEAFIYTEGTMYDLLSLLVPGSSVSGLSINPLGNSINDSGQIVATGTIGNSSHALLLTPTPEPSSAVLLLGSGAMLLLRRRRSVV